MKKDSVTLNDIKLVGISVRTSLQNEMNPATAKIAPTVGKFLAEQYGEQISHRVKPGVLYACYTDYEDEYRAGYTYFIGEEVSTFSNLPAGASTLMIPAGNYTRFTTEKGVMPLVLISAWQNIWLMGESGLGGKRRYNVDFEIYDERAKDPQNTVIDIYIGLS